MRSARLVVRGFAVVAVGLSLAACREKSSSASGSLATNTSTARGAGMMDSVEAYSRAMSNMTPDQLAAVMPMHRQMVTNLIAQMTTDMQRANVVPDPAWRTTADSLQRDLTRTTGVTKLQLKQAMPAQNARLERLVGMYQETMAKTNGFPQPYR